MSAPSTVATALASLLDTAPSWLPQVDHWEIAEDSNTWILSGQLAGDPREAEAFRLLAPMMERAPSAHSDDGRLVKVPFEWDGVTGQVWYLRPVDRYVVPERCATCATPLADAGNQFVRLGGRGAPVICVPCRDRMHEAWVREAAVRELGALPMPVGPEPQTDDRTKAPWGRGEDGRPLLPMGAHWTDVPEAVDRWVAKIQARVDEAKPGPWYRAPATELGVTPGTVRTRIDGYPRMVGQFTNVSPADLEMVLYAGSDLRWCLEMIAKFRARVAELEAKLAEYERPADEDPIAYALTDQGDVPETALGQVQAILLAHYGELSRPDLAVGLLLTNLRAELEAAPRTVYRASHDSIPMGLYTTAAEARAHCEADERRSWMAGTTLSFDWIEDDGGAELVVTAGQNEESTTNYVVEALEVAAKYDAEADE
ncbi:hypothetical protein [Streptomyces sp. M92]|uniref:hypothetical protein n=1 Tax=Streptomyces sp. M92 TaxID=2944250 RepID=UPI00234AEE04|nr:hypothetical protein [Streptomyces sp. M92]WCN06008.1 hypothetical protein M6G08_30195 [Streptomyces sp. M92]